MRLPLLSAVMVCVLPLYAAHAQAVEWDHEANLAGAVDAFVEAYHAGGMPQAEKIAADCQNSLAAIPDDIQRLMRFQFCAGMDLSGYLTNRRDMDEKAYPGSEYFDLKQVQMRLDRLSEFVPHPGTHTQVLHAWGRSVAGALDKRLK